MRHLYHSQPNEPTSRERFEAERCAYQQRVEHCPDADAQARDRLHAAIESALFSQHYHRYRGDLLGGISPPQSPQALADCHQRRREAEREYQRHVAEWSARAVRDHRYPPRDAAMAKRVQSLQAEEARRWSKFEQKAAANDWTPARRAREQRFVQAALDRTLSIALGLTLAQERSR